MKSFTERFIENIEKAHIRAAASIKVRIDRGWSRDGAIAWGKENNNVCYDSTSLPFVIEQLDKMIAGELLIEEAE